MGMERHFDKKQAAEFLGVSPHTIIAWKKRGILGFTRLGRAIRYPESELIRFGLSGPPPSQLIATTQNFSGTLGFGLRSFVALRKITGSFRIPPLTRGFIA
jgi:excisionase family DNA binding protein